MFLENCCSQSKLYFKKATQNANKKFLLPKNVDPPLTNLRFHFVVFFDFLRCFGMFRDVLRCFGRIVATDSSSKPRKQPKIQRTIRWTTKICEKGRSTKKRMTSVSATLNQGHSLNCFRRILLNRFKTSLGTDAFASTDSNGIPLLPQAKLTAVLTVSCHSLGSLSKTTLS